MLPRLSAVLRDNTHRLIPSHYSEHDESVLTRLTDEPDDLNALFELEGATNDRLIGEAGLLPGITVRELVFGLSYSHIVNAAFTHASPFGSRFNGPDRGAWYAGFSRETSENEVAYHKMKELQEINWQEKETFSYADFHFYPAVLPVKPERDNRLTLDRAQGKEFGNLRFVEQKFPATFWFVLAVTGTFVRLDICVVKINLVILHSREGVIQVCESGADGFDLRSLQFDSSLYPFENLIVMERTAIGCDLGGHKSQPARGVL